MSNAQDIIVPSFDDDEHAGRKLAIIDASDFIELTARAQPLFS